MSFLTDILIAVLGVYLALTNSLADTITNFLPVDATAQHVDGLEPQTAERLDQTKLGALGTAYEIGGKLPNILIENAAYQQAAVLTSADKTAEKAATVEEALVNIYCTYKTDTSLRTTTGTGFFIDPAGVVMTNAHVAQFLLLETVNHNGETECVLRTGNPAVANFKADLLYISPAWIQKHAALIDNEQPKGTGERDFALLYVTAGLDNQPLPGQFPYLAVNTDLLSKRLLNQEVVVAGYPAENLSLADRNHELRPVSATSSISDMLTFVSNYADVITLSESSVGSYGASGGPVLDSDGHVIGLISTKGSEADGPNSLRAITLSYIDRAILEDSTFDLKRTMSGQLAFRARLFKETIVPFLSKVLESEL